MVGLAAVKSQAAMLYVVFGAMIGAMQVSAILAMAMLAGIHVRRKSPDRAWQGQTVHISYYVRNSRRSSCLALTVEDASATGESQVANGPPSAPTVCAVATQSRIGRAAAGLVRLLRMPGLRKTDRHAQRGLAPFRAVDEKVPVPAGQDPQTGTGTANDAEPVPFAAVPLPVPFALQAADGYCAHLRPHSVFRCGTRMIARVRGRLAMGSLIVRTAFPFGLVEARRLLAMSDPVIVWPQRGRLRTQLLRHGAVETSAAAPSRGPGGEDEFFGLREYRSDDNPRWIHWRRSASYISRKLAPVVREMNRPLPEVLYVLLETRLADKSPITAGRFEASLRLAATIVDHALSRGYSVGLLMPGGQAGQVIAAAGSRANRTKLLDALALAQPSPAGDLSSAIKSLRPGQLRQAQVLLISAGQDQPPAMDLRLLGRSCRHLQVVTGQKLAAIFEDAPPPGGPA